MRSCAAKFNLEQLHYWQKQAVADLDVRGFWLWAGSALENQVDKAHQDLFVETIKPNVMFPSDIQAWIAILFGSGFVLNNEQRELLADVAPDYFKTALDFVEKQGADYAALIAHLKSTLSVKGKALFMPLRIALTGEAHGPELAKVMVLLGDDEVKRRLIGVIEK